ncbi:polyprenyl synthetase family protein, partial [bacterium]|nr:polyprenyl synthetase family protein [bacterium]
ESRIKLVNDYLESNLARFEKSCSLRFEPLIEAMRYSLEGGGKRLRPLLTLSAAEALGLDPKSVLPAACALEYIHSYSLIHDDLPALDDDDTRRGKPSSHKRFGEAVAILAGDALLTEAFGQVLLLGESGRFQPAQILGVIDLLSHHSGVRGMVGGQLLDVTIDTSDASLPEIEFIHIHKTGAMIVASVLLPARLCGLEEKKSALLKRYGAALGLAFQISDDILDAESSNRYSRGPRKKARPAYSELMNRAEMQDLLNNLIDTANTCAQALGDKSSHLVDIAEFIRNRKH